MEEFAQGSEFSGAVADAEQLGDFSSTFGRFLSPVLEAGSVWAWSRRLICPTVVAGVKHPVLAAPEEIDA